MRAFWTSLALTIFAAPMAFADVTDDQIGRWTDIVLDDVAITSAEAIQRRVIACYAEVYEGETELVERCTTMHFTAAIIEREMAGAMGVEVGELYRNDVMAGVIATHFEKAGKTVDERNAFTSRALEVIYARMDAWMASQ